MTVSLNQTMPQRETVARVTKLRFSTSNRILTLAGMASLSPLGKVSSLLSSRTELRFSAHSGSQSPSKTIQCLFWASPFWFPRILLNIPVKIPSYHSMVYLSIRPYKWSLLTALGSMIYSSPFLLSCNYRVSSKALYT